jgi:hypothetical protein
MLKGWGGLLGRNVRGGEEGEGGDERSILSR